MNQKNTRNTLIEYGLWCNITSPHDCVNMKWNLRAKCRVIGLFFVLFFHVRNMASDGVIGIILWENYNHSCNIANAVSRFGDKLMKTGMAITKTLRPLNKGFITKFNCLESNWVTRFGDFWYIYLGLGCVYFLKKKIYCSKNHTETKKRRLCPPFAQFWHAYLALSLLSYTIVVWRYFWHVHNFVVVNPPCRQSSIVHPLYVSILFSLFDIFTRVTPFVLLKAFTSTALILFSCFYQNQNYNFCLSTNHGNLLSALFLG